jgi:hypothetical protein
MREVGTKSIIQDDFSDFGLQVLVLVGTLVGR